MSTQEPSLLSPGGPARRSTGMRLWRRFSFYGFLAVAGVTVASAAYPPPERPSAAPAEPQAVQQAAATAAVESPLDEPLRLVNQAAHSYRNVRDYQCKLIKRERVGNVLQPQNTMLMYARTTPFSIYFRWLEPTSLAGQEVCFVAGRYNNNMRVHPNGLRSMVGFVTLDVNDPRARATSRHAITEAGIGALIGQLATSWEKERQWNATRVQTAVYTFDGRRCTRVDMIHPANRDGRYLHYRDIVYFDQESHLPVRMEAYDWPRYQGDAGDLLEMYSYVSLRFNVGLRDDIFNH